MALNPTITVLASTPFGGIGGGFTGGIGGGRIMAIQIQFGPTDTYVTGGFNLYPSGGLMNPQNLTPQVPNAIEGIIAGQLQANTAVSWEQTLSTSNGVATIKLLNPTVLGPTLQTGTGQVAAGASVGTVNTGISGLASIFPTTPINVSLTDYTVPGGATGTWGTQSVAKIDYLNATAFELHLSAAAPSGGGNFAWSVPNTNVAVTGAELTAGTSVANAIINAELIVY